MKRIGNPFSTRDHTEGGTTILTTLRRSVWVPAAILAVAAAAPFTGTAHASNVAPPQTNSVNPWGTPHCPGGAVTFIAGGGDLLTQDAACTDKQVYVEGDPVTICYDVSYRNEDIELWLNHPMNGWAGVGMYNTLLASGYDDGTGDCFHSVAGMPGTRTLTLERIDAQGGGFPIYHEVAVVHYTVVSSMESLGH